MTSAAFRSNRAPRRLVTSIDEACEHRVKLICAADVQPDELCPDGEVAPLLRRTDSRLIRMQRTAFVELPQMI